MTTPTQDTPTFGRGSGAPTAPTTVLPPSTVTARRTGLAAPEILRRVCDGIIGALFLDLMILCAWWGIDLDGEDSDDDGIDWDH